MFSVKVDHLEAFHKILKHLEKFHFLRPRPNQTYGLGSLGEKVSNNIIFEWKRSNIIYREHNVFMLPARGGDLSTNLKEAFSFAKNICHSSAPFGMASVTYGRTTLLQEPVTVDPGPEMCLLKYIVFLPPSEAKQYYYRWQVQRKRWWRIFSRDPGRFSVIGTDDEQVEDVSILCKFPWGSFQAESISYLGTSWVDKFSIADSAGLTVLNGRKRVLPHVVVCTVCADIATLLYLSDAYYVLNKKPVMCFHRKLAPFKYAFIIQDQEDHEVALEMATMLCLELRRKGLPVLWPAITQKNPGEFDSIGIPYSIIIGSESMNSGIIELRDRDTSLSEQVHISEMGDYGELIMKNYEIKNF